VTPLPGGLGLVLDRSVQIFRRGTVLVGGHPGRMITLSAEGSAILSKLLVDGTTSDAGGRLGRRLVDAGMAHPRRPTAVTPATGRVDGRVTVVVPVHNRSDALERCLSSLGPHLSVMVVDDGSDDATTVARVCRRHGARLIRRETNGGPGAARNEALGFVESELVAFVDSDCRVTEGWIEQLIWWFDDPLVAAVAPRVRPDPPAAGGGGTALAKYTDGRSSLDMGPEPSQVGPDALVRYLPTAALVARRVALASGFDPDLRVGEDVDLVWRLLEQDWRVRYEPTATVLHLEPRTWRAQFGRRFRYGTSAAALSKRHPGRVPPVELRPWPTVAALALLCGRWRVAVLVVGASAAWTARTVRRRGIPLPLTIRWSAEGAAWTVIGMGRAATTLAGPVLALAVVKLRGRHRAAAAALVMAPPLVEWWRRRPDLDPVRWSLASILEDVSYGAGVWEGCFRARSFGPLVPAFRSNRPSGPDVTPEPTEMM
jgi:mycofactocin system glycosyltransferase